MSSFLISNFLKVLRRAFEDIGPVLSIAGVGKTQVLHKV